MSDENLPMPGEFVVACEFSHDCVRRRDLGEFLKHFGPQGLPGGTGVRPLLNSVILALGGYDQDPRELFEIAEARAFLKHLHRRWPYWLYFCSLQTGGLMTMTLCVLENLRVVRDAAEGTVQAHFGRLDLQEFLCGQLPGFQRMCLRAGMTTQESLERLAQVLAYYRGPGQMEE